MGMFDKLIANLRANRKTIVFTEGVDPRIQSAAARLLKDEILITPKVRLVPKGTLTVSDEKKAVRVKDLRKLF